MRSLLSHNRFTGATITCSYCTLLLADIAGGAISTALYTQGGGVLCFLD